MMKMSPQGQSVAEGTGRREEKMRESVLAGFGIRGSHSRQRLSAVLDLENVFPRGSSMISSLGFLRVVLVEGCRVESCIMRDRVSKGALIRVPHGHDVPSFDLLTGMPR